MNRENLPTIAQNRPLSACQGDGDNNKDEEETIAQRGDGLSRTQ